MLRRLLFGFTIPAMFVIKSIVKQILLWVFIGFFASSIGMVLLYKVMPVYVTPLMVIRLFQQHSRGESLRLHHRWVPMSEISGNLPLAVVSSEDQLFMSHHGFDLKQIENAAFDRIEGKRKRGGSTISQQTAKNVFLWPASSWVRKGFEAYFTVLIEFVWGKERIMEVYLNSIEMGDGIYGADAVARRHFHTNAANLSRGECALIAATLPNPLRFNSAAPSPYVRKRKAAILKEMRYMEPRLSKLLKPGDSAE